MNVRLQDSVLSFDYSRPTENRVMHTADDEDYDVFFLDRIIYHQQLIGMNHKRCSSAQYIEVHLRRVQHSREE